MGTIEEDDEVGEKLGQEASAPPEAIGLGPVLLMDVGAIWLVPHDPSLLGHVEFQMRHYFFPVPFKDNAEVL
ncbi:hypothetical protein PanWU01x14_196370 [Parasponia andersonii]|uniref:Uncharacterized protein n=1 Tax=Parasponia andersonii TaxID=3476 RepID=A0A2P5BZL8_PARAD|nr:hypothetical protein PanWU01x14_196370 [Parasponia andersonii]